MEMHNSPRGRRLHRSVAAFMGVVAALAVLMACCRGLMADDPPAPDHILDRLPQRMQRLRPGMTDREVWRKLGLAGYRKGHGMGRGPLSNYTTFYSPGPGYRFLMYSDETQTPSRFLRGYLEYRDGVVESPPGPPFQRVPAMGRARSDPVVRPDAAGTAKLGLAQGRGK